MLESRRILNVLLICLFFQLAQNFIPTFPCALANNAVAPERNIRVIGVESTHPAWKNKWDIARNLVNSKQFSNAALAYKSLLEIKPNLEEASWEYCKVLFNLEDYTAVSQQLQSLLEMSPDRVEYLLMAAKVDYINENFTEAVVKFGKVLEAAPAGQLSDEALEGFAFSLRHKGMQAQSVLLMEQLLLRRAGNSSLMKTIAHDWLLLGDKVKARQFYKVLLETKPVDSAVLFEAADAYDETGYEDELISLLNRCLERKPLFSKTRERLFEAYLQKWGCEK